MGVVFMSFINRKSVSKMTHFLSSMIKFWQIFFIELWTWCVKIDKNYALIVWHSLCFIGVTTIVSNSFNMTLFIKRNTLILRVSFYYEISSFFSVYLTILMYLNWNFYKNNLGYIDIQLEASKPKWVNSYYIYMDLTHLVFETFNCLCNIGSYNVYARIG